MKKMIAVELYDRHQLSTTRDLPNYVRVDLSIYYLSRTRVQHSSKSSHLHAVSRLTSLIDKRMVSNLRILHIEFKNNFSHTF